ncbi:MAG: MATE family efflux transporter [Blautia sp.]|nr:MATE family efflux transporter [Blautia sp.]
MERLFTSRDLRRLIVPLVFEQALAITVGMADTMMVASVGEAAISGVSLVDMINNLIFSVLAALSTGGAVVVSQNLGARRTDEACHSAKQLLYTVIFAGTCVGALCLVFRAPLLRLFFGRIEDDVMADGLTYLSVTALSFPFLAVYNACAALFRSMGNSKITLKISVIINLINIAGNALCIFVLKMGVAGVAVPSLVSRAVGGIILYVLLRNPEETVHFIKGSFTLEWSVIRKILYIGIPSGIENGIFQLGRVLVVSIISGFGTMQIAANGVANNLDSVGCIIGQAMNLAIITVIGRCVGANDEKQVRYYTVHLLKITYVSTFLLNAPVLLGLRWILSIYGLSSETTALAARLVFIHNGCAMVLWPIAFVLPNMLRACNDVAITMIVSILSMFTFRVALSYVIGVRMGMGAVGVWIAMVVDWVFRSAWFVGRYYQGGWRRTAHLVR